MRALILIALLALLVPSVAAGNAAAYYIDGYFDPEPRIVVETKDCSGAAGLASFRAERVFTIQESDCQNPDAGNQVLHQVLLESVFGVSRYDVIWVDQTGLETIRQQLEENRQLALRRRAHY